jgi:hypothetical protein
MQPQHNHLAEGPCRETSHCHEDLLRVNPARASPCHGTPHHAMTCNYVCVEADLGAYQAESRNRLKSG